MLSDALDYYPSKHKLIPFTNPLRIYCQVLAKQFCTRIRYISCLDELGCSGSHQEELSFTHYPTCLRDPDLPESKLSGHQPHRHLNISRLQRTRSNQSVACRNYYSRLSCCFICLQSLLCTREDVKHSVTLERTLLGAHR
jgi:hypothetical protein